MSSGIHSNSLINLGIPNRQRARPVPPPEKKIKAIDALLSEDSDLDEASTDVEQSLPDNPNDGFISVAVRVRPINSQELSNHCNEVVRCVDGNMIVIMENSSTDDYLRANRIHERQYIFDHVFSSDVNQDEVYENTTKPLIEGVLEGYNATVFAYGPTGSGKTYTMLGTESEPGCMIRALSELYKKIKNSNYYSYTVSLSYVEIYNENIYDLLIKDSKKVSLSLREDPVRGPRIANVTEISVSSISEIQKLLKEGNSRRTKESTYANKESSRSHAILQISVQRKDRAEGTKSSVRFAKLSMIDLAGSERAANTKNRGQRLKEGANINRSLLALGNVINALANKQNHLSHIPYRDSKLTRLLKDSLGGNCRTCMISTISPSSHAFEETLNTLKYANRAKNIKTRPTKNVLNVEYHIAEYQNLISKLKEEVNNLRVQLKEEKEAHKLENNNNNNNNSNNNNNNRKNNNKKNKRKDNESVSSYNESSDESDGSDSDDDNNNSSSIPSPRELDKKSNNNKQLNVITNIDDIVRKKSEYINVFQENMELRKNLVEIESQEQQLNIEIHDKEELLKALKEKMSKNSNSNNEYNNKRAEKLKVEISGLENDLLKSRQIKEQILKKIENNKSKSFRLEKTSKRVMTPSEFNEMIKVKCRIQELEIKNMELEKQKMECESRLQEKDDIIMRLREELEIERSNNKMNLMNNNNKHEYNHKSNESIIEDTNNSIKSAVEAVNGYLSNIKKNNNRKVYSKSNEEGEINREIKRGKDISDSSRRRISKLSSISYDNDNDNDSDNYYSVRSRRSNNANNRNNNNNKYNAFEVVKEEKEEYADVEDIDGDNVTAEDDYDDEGFNSNRNNNKRIDNNNNNNEDYVPFVKCSINSRYGYMNTYQRRLLKHFPKIKNAYSDPVMYNNNNNRQQQPPPPPSLPSNNFKVTQIPNNNNALALLKNRCNNSNNNNNNNNNSEDSNNEKYLMNKYNNNKSNLPNINPKTKNRKIREQQMMFMKEKEKEIDGISVRKVPGPPPLLRHKRRRFLGNVY